MRVKDKLTALGVTPSKGRGQHFLINEEVLNKIIEFGSPAKGEKLVEIGPGLGALTERLLEIGDVTGIEIEDEFAEALKERYKNLTVLHNDVREVDFKEIGESLTVFGNLPYSFSSDIVLALLEARSSIKRAILLLQKEFAERLSAKPCTRAYGSLSIAVQLWADCELGPTVPGSCFHPPTKVTSQLISLNFLPAPRVHLNDPNWFEKIVRASFSKKRKTILNSLSSSGLFSRERALAALTEAGIDPIRRAETLSIQEFSNLAETLSK